MGKKKETISLIDTFSEFNELKNIDGPLNQCAGRIVP